MVSNKRVSTMRKAFEKSKTLRVAARAGDMDEKTARKYLRDPRQPKEIRKLRTSRTRPDPFAAVQDELQELLENEPRLDAKTIFAELKRRHPGMFKEGQLRTLQRHVKVWRATQGHRKEVMFAQKHHPGRMGAFDFTNMNSLLVTIRGVHFKHLVYHFVLTYSNWEYVRICIGETFENVSVGLQGALWELGGVPEVVRFDNLTAAVLTIGKEKRLQARYAALVRYYGLNTDPINAGQPHENGDAEASNKHFKHTVDQALLLRGSRDFDSKAAYAEFLQAMIQEKNAPRAEKLAEERVMLHALPAQKLEARKIVRLRVGAGSTIAIERNVYSVDSRLIGEKIEAHIYAERIEVWYGQRKREELPRLLGRGSSRVDYRHIIDWLVRKPGAFANYRYRDELFPGMCFRMTYDQLVREQPLRATKEYLGILYCAAKAGEERVRTVLEELLAANTTACAAEVKARVSVPTTAPPILAGEVAPVSLAAYDALLKGTYGQEAGHACT